MSRQRSNRLTDRALRRARLAIQLTLATFLFAMIGALLISSQLGSRLGVRYTPMLDAVLHVKLATTTAHLWIEEILSGDVDEPVAQVWRALDTAEREVREVLEGSRAIMLPFERYFDPELLDQLGELQQRLTEMRQLALERVENIAIAGVGSELDRRYDALFHSTLQQCGVIEGQIEAAAARDLALFRWLQAGLVGACGLLLLFGIWLTSAHVTRLGVEVQQRRHTERKLRSSEEEARAANQAKDVFLAKVSHEVRTPINSIVGMSTLLGDTRLDGEQLGYLRILNAEARDLVEIVDDLLDFSKIEAGKLTLYPEPFDLRQVAADTVDLMMASARKNGNLLDIDLAPDFPAAVVGDQVRLRQVLLNLLRNADKFTRGGSLTVELCWERDAGDPACARVTLAVSDTGIGIAPDELGHIFEAFAQVDESAKRRYGGLGLGLTICREVVERMGGSIDVQSEVGHGTRFWVTLPLAIAEEARSWPLLDGQRVLVVDLPDPSRARTLALVRSAGLEPVAVDEAAVLLSLLRLGTVHAVVLSDRVAPPSLEELLTRIGTSATPPPVYVLLSELAPGQAECLGAAGACAVLTRAHRALMLPALLHGEEPPVVQPAQVPDSVATGRCFDASVLLVDDHPVTRLAGRHMLETLGCHVDVAADGREALSRWRQGHYDLVLMDWQMPDFDGIDVTAFIRDEERSGSRAPTTIIAMTAHASAEHRSRCLEAGMNDHMSKPVTRDGLRAILEQYLPAARTVAQ